MFQLSVLTYHVVMERSLYARELILDEGGKLDAMMNVSYGDGSGISKAEFGDDVLNASRAIMEHDGSS